MTMAMTERFQGQDLLRVGTGDSFMLLAPEHGGRLVRWVHRGDDILYWPENADWTRVSKVRGGNPLLFPFIGRHFVDGEAAKWRDAESVVRDMPQHGFARDLPFAVLDASDQAVRLTLAGSKATHAWYPFAWVFEAGYRLLPDGLEATLTVRNAGNTPVPHYAGHHFYFALAHAQRNRSSLVIPAAVRVRQRTDGTLTDGEPGEALYRVDDPRLQDTFHVLDHMGTIRLEMPSRTIAIETGTAGGTPWHAVATWTEHDDADFYCVEPWLGLPNAIHDHQGLRWVAPHAQMSATCRLRIV
ncbi:MULTISPECIES: aldose epimerase family protein [unclassified Cupriavidus]|uniref:aldose epimerase family protein n=1 Tax=Cupriavidus sp. H19C3 TaxID=3241603 RepID=UPI003BF7ACC2